MPNIEVERDRCKGCELCTVQCPQQILAMSKEINAKGYFFAQVVDEGRCIGCMICAVTCPDVAITVTGTGVQYRLFDYFPAAPAVKGTARPMEVPWPRAAGVFWLPVQPGRDVPPISWAWTCAWIASMVKPGAFPWDADAR